MSPARPLGAAAAARSPEALAEALSRAALLSLRDELALAPKPGLVSFVDSGSHADMDAQTFLRSLMALRGYFHEIALLGAHHAPFEALERAGQAAERAMLHATGGVNTHRGAIFVLGLLCAAAGRAAQTGQGLQPDAVREALLQGWGDALARRAQRQSSLPGGIAARRWGLRGASEEAALGFPALFDTGLPAWQAAQARGGSAEQVRAQAFFALLATLDDCNLAHRGGLEGLAWARLQAREFLNAGGALSPQWHARAWTLHRRFVARRLSPGGCADLLSALCWLERVRRLA